MRLEVNQLNSEIKSAGQTIRIKYARRNISQVHSIRQFSSISFCQWDQGSTNCQLQGPTSPNRSVIFKNLLVLVSS